MQKTLIQNKSVLSGNILRLYFIVLIGSGILYFSTCAPVILWQDSGLFVYRIWHNDLKGDLGLALAHPLYIMIGIVVKCISLGDLAWRINLLSAVFGAVTVANVFLLIRLWLGKNTPAVLAAATLAFSHTIWQFASIAEVYTLYTALLTAELIFLLQYIRTKRVGYLYLLGLCNGLAIANHMWAAIAFLCYTVFLVVLLIQKQIRLRHFAVIVALWLIGAAPYEYLIIRNIITHNFTDTIASALFGNSWQGKVLNTTLSVKLVKENLILMAYNFPTPNVIFFFAGLYGLKKLSPARSFANILLALLVLFFLFAFRYNVPDRYAFFMPFYCLACVFMGAGMHRFLQSRSRRPYIVLLLVFVFLPLPVYTFAPAIAQRLKFDLGTKRTIPHRNEYVWFLRPWNGRNVGPELFASEALESVEDNAIIIADGTTVYPLWYLQEVKGKRTDVKVLSLHGSYKSPVAFPTEDTIAEMLAQNRVYVVSPLRGYCPDYLLENYDFVKIGPIYLMLVRR